MELLQEANTFDYHKLAESFRHVLPTDARYVALYRRSQQTVNAITDKGCEFRLLPTSDIYLINDMKLHMKIRLVTKDTPHTTPITGTYVGPVNNIMHSCINEVKLQINGQPGLFFTFPYLFLVLKLFLFQQARTATIIHIVATFRT